MYNTLLLEMPSIPLNTFGFDGIKGLTKIYYSTKLGVSHGPRIKVYMTDVNFSITFSASNTINRVIPNQVKIPEKTLNQLITWVNKNKLFLLDFWELKINEKEFKKQISSFK